MQPSTYTGSQYVRVLVAGVIQLSTDASLVAISLTLTAKDRNGNVIADPTHTREGDQSCSRAT